MKRSTVRLLVRAGLAVVLLGVAACSGSPNGDDQGGCAVKIGFLGALSGGNASIVLPARDAAKLAFKQFEAEDGRCDVTLTPFDTGGDPAKAVPVAERIVDDEKFVGVIGGAFSGETRKIKGIFDRAGVTMISASATATDLTAKDPAAVFHRVVGHDEIQAAATAKFLTETLKARAVFVVDDGTAYGQPLADKVKELAGDAILASDRVLEMQTDFTTTVSRIKAAKADTVYYAGYANEAAPFLKQLRDAGVDAPFVGSDGMYGSDFAQVAGERADGAIITCACIPPEKASGSFATDYEAEYGAKPGAYAAESYDAATIFLEAVNAGNTARDEVEKFVDGYDKTGISKHIKFNDKGDVARDSVVIWTYQLKDGELVPHEEVSFD